MTLLLVLVRIISKAALVPPKPMEPKPMVAGVAETPTEGSKAKARRILNTSAFPVLGLVAFNTVKSPSSDWVMPRVTSKGKAVDQAEIGEALNWRPAPQLTPRRSVSVSVM